MLYNLSVVCSVSLIMSRSRNFPEMSSKLIFVSQGTAAMMSFISTCGVIFLVIMGSLYAAAYEPFLEGHDAPKDHKLVARGCFVSAFIYAMLLVVCLGQNYLHSKVNSQQQRFTGI
ncbi:hypothetical protein EDD86DRAFT_208204 [Gorgonomyces haynaldii]|nr:hypothetical protein EDD86DRAFT_208204 [Gorgonomyces haynaldii]